MNILQVIPRFNPILGGGVNVVNNVSKGLVKRGHRVTVLTTKRCLDEGAIAEIRKTGVEVITFDYVFDFHLFIYTPKIKNWLATKL
jgi:hypothetical protein